MNSLPHVLDSDLSNALAAIRRSLISYAAGEEPCRS
jgi:hypothetical protein